MPYVYRPLPARIICGAVVTLSVVIAGWIVADNGWDEVLLSWPWLALLAGSSWLLLWRPRVMVDEALVTIVNPFRTIRLPWPALDDVDTRFALTLHTAYGRFAAWAVPAPGGLAVRRFGSTARHGTDADLATSPPGDLPGTASGDVAAVIRSKWDEHRDAGHLDDRRLDPHHRAVSWAWPLVAATVVVVAACVVSTLV